MNKFTTKLTKGQLERLAFLSEEMGEAQQAIGKIIRHGYDSYDPTKDDSPDNKEFLERELGDVRAAMIMLCNSGDLDKETIHQNADAKMESVKQWMHSKENQ